MYKIYKVDFLCLILVYSSKEEGSDTSKTTLMSALYDESE